MASPLFYSGDLTASDEFTVNLPTSREVIATNHDLIGECARVVSDRLQSRSFTRR